MDIEEKFKFLVEEYGCVYQYQEFHKCYGGDWIVYTYSFYNENGCFTIRSMPQRGELDFYYAHKFSTCLEKLCDKMINVCSVEEELWEKHTKIRGLKNPFFWWRIQNVLNVLAEVIKVHIKEHGEFFGIKV